MQISTASIFLSGELARHLVNSCTVPLVSTCPKFSHPPVFQLVSIGKPSFAKNSRKKVG